MLKKVPTQAVAPQALEGARSATGSACGAADEVKRVSARIVWTRFWDSGGLFKHPCLTGFEG